MNKNLEGEGEVKRSPRDTAQITSDAGRRHRLSISLPRRRRLSLSLFLPLFRLLSLMAVVRQEHTHFSLQLFVRFLISSPHPIFFCNTCARVLCCSCRCVPLSDLLSLDASNFRSACSPDDSPIPPIYI